MTSAMAVSSTGTVRIPELDGWRGVSIMLVVCSHVLFNRYVGSPAQGLDTVPFGAWGVRLFFIISGFIICKLTLDEIRSTGSFSVGDFWIRRVFRIMPPLLVYLLFIGAASALGVIHESVVSLVMASAFACNLPTTHCGWYVGHTWSLAFEEQFYVFFPVVMLAGPRRTRMIFLVLPVALVVLSRPALGEAVLGPFGRELSSYLGSFIALFLGVLCALREPDLRHIARRHGPKLTLLASVVLLAVAADFLWSDGSSVWRMRLRGIVDVTLVPVAMSWLIVSSTFGRGVYTALLTSTPMRFLGSISYSLYLWQQLFTGNPLSYAPGSPFLFWPAMFVIAYLSYRFVEKPFARLGKVVSARRRAALAASASSESPTSIA